MRRQIAKILIVVFLISSLFTVSAYADSGVITGDYVNFRTGPGTSYGIICCLRYGTSVSVSGSEGGWTSVTYNGESGYVSSQYVSVSGSSGPVITSPQATAAPAESDAQTSPATPEPVQTPAPTQAPSNGSSGSIVVIGPSSSGSSGTKISYGTPSSDQNDASAQQSQQTPEQTPAPSAAPAADTASTDGSTGYINGDYVRFRSGPSTSYTILGTYNKGKTLSISGTSGDWTKCTIDGRIGYVFSQYVKTGSAVVQTSAAQPSPSPAAQSQDSAQSAQTGEPEATAAVTQAGYISGNNVRFRSGPSLDASILGEFFYGNSVTITGTAGDWTAVSANGNTGYVYSQYVKSGTYSQNAGSSNEKVTASGQAVVDFAMQYLGSPYCWGGTDPSTGFDCSGFVYYVYSHFNITLNRVAQDQASNGSHVDPADLQPGDILCFYSGSNYIGHVGIYIGNGKFIHSATSSTGVIITSLAGNYTTRGYEARRIVS